MKLRKAVTVLTILCIMLTIIITGLNYLMPIYLSYKLNRDAGDIGSIGIIGGADGPTSIYLSSQPSSYKLMIIFAFFSTVGVIYMLLTKKSAE